MVGCVLVLLEVRISSSSPWWVICFLQETLPPLADGLMAVVLHVLHCQ